MDKVRILSILVHKKVQCINNINSILFTKSLSFVDQTERTLGTLTKVIKLNKVIEERQKNICLVDCRIFRMDLNTEYINKTLNIHNQRGDIEIILIRVQTEWGQLRNGVTNIRLVSSRLDKSSFCEANLCAMFQNLGWFPTHWIFEYFKNIKEKHNFRMCVYYLNPCKMLGVLPYVCCAVFVKTIVKIKSK